MSGGKKFWIGLGVSVGFLALFFLTLDIGRLLDALAGANYLFLAPAIGLYMVSVLFRTLRWQRLLRPLRPVKLARLFPVVVIGYMANNLLPMRLGELVRSYYVGEREGISKTSALVTIFIERLLDALTLLLFVVVIALFAPVTGLAQAFKDSHGAAWLLAGAALALIFAVAFGSLLLVAFVPTRARAIAKALVTPMPGHLGLTLQHLFDMFLDGVQTLSSPGSILVLFALSVPIWLFEAGLFFLIGYSFGLHEVYPSLGHMAVAVVLVTAIANIGSSIPAAPGGIGLFELVARETLVLLPLATVDPDVAGAYVLVVHAALLLPMIVLGQIFLWTQHISLRRLSRAGRSATGGPD
jgi:uncharacterized protein (TIRG00374 family)